LTVRTTTLIETAF